MNHRLRTLTLLLLSLVLLLPTPGASAQPQSSWARIGIWTLDTVADWSAGVGSDTLVTNNAGGELRLANGRRSATFLSTPFATDGRANAAALLWQAELPPGTALALELRARATPPSADSDAGWGEWQAIDPSDVRVQGVGGVELFASPDPILLPEASRYLQLRIFLTSERPPASALLDRVTVAYFDTTMIAPPVATDLPRQAISAGPVTLSPRPTIIARSVWSGSLEAAQPFWDNPRGIIIHQIDLAEAAERSLDLVRALHIHQTAILGWADLSYHYLIDPAGNLFEGRLGGPTSLVEQMSAGDRAIHVALLNPRTDPPTPSALQTLVNLLAWLGEAYAIAPDGWHTVGDGTIRRMNITGHAEVVAAATDPYLPLRELLPQIRVLADQSIIRSRWYFAEGNTVDYTQQLVIFNPGQTRAEARVTLVRPGAIPLLRILDLPAGGRADLMLHELAQGAAVLPTMVESSAPLLVERRMGMATDLDGGLGIDRLARTWYFAAGSTEVDSRTFLLLFNPNPRMVRANITYMRQDGVNLTQMVEVAGQDRLVITVGDITQPDCSQPLRGVRFGTQVVADQPIAVERTVRFGSDQSGLQVGRGIRDLSRHWYFAEGTTEGDFRMRIILLNPNNQISRVEATFMDRNGERVTRRYAVAPRRPLTIDVGTIVPARGVSTLLRSDLPIAAERELRFNGDSAGSLSMGATELALRWAFADGWTQDAHYYLCVSNPGPLPTQVTVDLGFTGATTGSQRFTVPAGARYVLALHELYPNEPLITALVRATQPIVAERSIYPGGGAGGGFTVMGLPMP